ncbi:28037_t:CDS:2, partial [Gigaspora margarita]
KAFYNIRVAKITQPFVPLISSVFVIVSEAVKIYKNAKYNKNICTSLLVRINITKTNVEILQLQPRICDHKAFYRLVEVLKKIKNFMNDVSNLSGWKKYAFANSVQETFTKLISEFDKSMDNLHFTITISNEQQRKLDQENLNGNVEEMKQFLEIIAGSITDTKSQINTIINEVQIINKKVYNLIHDPNNMINLKALYKVNDVACKFTNILDNRTSESQRIQAQLVILEKLKEFPNILRFYGLSNVNDNQVMVFEWTDKGNLKELYEQNDINWDEKVHIALDICRGLIFLQSCDILHHDIRCKNIMFWNVTLGIDIRKIPYKDLGMNKIMKIVINGNREKITFGQTTLEHQKIQKGLKKIIIAAWKQNPKDRILFANIFKKLHSLSLKCDQPHYQTSLYPDGHFDLDGSKLPKMSLIKSLEDGIGYHKIRDYETAWSIFEYHAELGNSDAKFWKARYLAVVIFVKKDIVQAAKLFKEAAEDNNIDACFRYALLMTDKAADAGNAMAQYNLGNMHLKGNSSTLSNSDLGIKYLKLAALNGHSKAIEVLKEKDININE